VDSPITAKAALLQVLSRGSGIGQVLIRRVSACTNGKLILGSGSVYPALRELERAGLITGSEDRDPTHSGKPRRCYAITRKGRYVAKAHRALIEGLFA
jgi:PadR family transcriptional regulator, regulatory protein PadR